MVRENIRLSMRQGVAAKGADRCRSGPMSGGYHRGNLWWATP